VFAVGYPDLSWRGRLMGAVLACGAGALLSHWSGAALRDLVRESGASIHVTTPGGSRLNVEGIVKHRARNLSSDDYDEVDGIPITSLARTLLDLAPAMPHWRLARALEDAERRDLLDVHAIRLVCDRNRGHRGAAPLLRQLGRLGPVPDTRSALERRFAAFCRRNGLPRPTFNSLISGLEVDASWPGRRLVVELDGWQYHRTRDAFERDRTRDARLAMAGYQVLRLTWRRLDEEPAEVASSLRTLLNSRVAEVFTDMA
jgi:very-short-patch-repair endonuclease